MKPRRPRAASTCPSAARLIVCWPLLSAVPRPYQRAAVGGELPRRAAVAPLAVVAGDDVAVAVDQHRGQRRILDALGEEHRRRAGDRVVPDRPAKAEPLGRGADLVREVARERRARTRDSGSRCGCRCGRARSSSNPPPSNQAAAAAIAALRSALIDSSRRPGGAPVALAGATSAAARSAGRASATSSPPGTSPSPRRSRPTGR